MPRTSKRFVISRTPDAGGVETRWAYVEDIGWDARWSRFVDLECRPIERCFKLYPWEWLWHEEFAAHLPAEPVQFIEPAWKMLLSNKGLLPILWELFPSHPNLLPAYEHPEPLGGSYVRKPKLSREGSNVALVEAGVVVEETRGEYGEEGHVYQAAATLCEFDGQRPVFGVWIVDHEAAGLRTSATRNALSPSSRPAGGLTTDEEENVARFRMKDGTILANYDNPRSYDRTDFQTFDLNVSLGTETVKARKSYMDEPRQMDWPALLAPPTETSNRAKLLDREIEIQRRLAVPFACVLLPLIGVPLGVQQSRAVRWRGIVVGLEVILLYYFFVTAGVTLVHEGVLPAPVALWTPNLALALAGWIVFRRASGERLPLARSLPAQGGAR